MIPRFAFQGRKSIRQAAASVREPRVVALEEPVREPRVVALVGELRGGAGEAAADQAHGSTENPAGCRWRRRGGAAASGCCMVDTGGQGSVLAVAGPRRRTYLLPRAVDAGGKPAPSAR